MTTGELLPPEMALWVKSQQPGHLLPGGSRGGVESAIHWVLDMDYLSILRDPLE